MTSVDVIPLHHPPALQPDRPLARVTGKVRKAIEAMVWGGLHRRDAAASAGLAEHSLYQALRRPPVRALYLSQLEVLRTSERARNIHTLAEVRDQQSNQMARVAAVKALEQIEETGSSSATRLQAPGLVLVIQQQPAAAAVDQRATNAANIRTIEHEQDQ